MTYVEAEKRAWKDVLNNDAIEPDRAIEEYKIALLGYGWQKTDNGPVPFENPGHQW